MGENCCPICGQVLDDSDFQSLDNGNPACLSCVEKEREKIEKQEMARIEQEKANKKNEDR